MLPWLVACGPPEPERLVAPDDARAGLDGADGPYGAARRTVRAGARVDDVIEVDLVYPADADGAPAVADAAAVVLVPGGFVDADRYLWLAGHLATRGYAVALPRPALGLAILHAGDPEVALGALADASAGGPLDGVWTGGPAVAAGHSLGGVVGGNWFLGHPEVDGAVLLASWPTADREPGDARPLLGLVGSRDGSATPDEVAAGLAGADAALGVIDGMTHYAWTDDATARERGSEPAPTRPVPALRRDACRVIDAFLDGVAGAAPPLDEPALPGVTWR